MTYVTVTIPYVFDADELWSRIWGAEPQSFGSWWQELRFEAVDTDWRRAGIARVTLEDPEDEEVTITQTITMSQIVEALSSLSFPDHLRRQILDDNTDCISADAVIQHIVYGEIIFG